MKQRDGTICVVKTKLLISYCTADLCLCFLYMQKSGFVLMWLQWKDSQGQMVDE